MALHYQLDKIYRWKSVCAKSDATWSWTNNFIWACLVLHMGSITKDNWKEWATRYLTMYPPPPHMTRRQARAWKKRVVKKVYQHIGLWTNVDKSHQRPTGRWYKQVIDRQMDQHLAFINIAHAENQMQREQTLSLRRKGEPNGTL